MLRRCGSPGNKAWHNYGGRGITVCERWRKFENFLADMGLRPTPQHSLDRYPDNNGNYEPGNCRWATRAEQRRNSRTVRLLHYDGKTMCMSEWDEALGFRKGAVGWRLMDGWTVKRALTQPLRVR